MPFEFNLSALAFLVFALLFIVNYVILFYYVYEMANTRGRSMFYWILCSFLITPLISIILLKCIGETDEKRKQRIIQEEELKQLVRNHFAPQEPALDKSRHPDKGTTPDSTGFILSAKTINDVYKRSR